MDIFRVKRFFLNTRTIIKPLWQVSAAEGMHFHFAGFNTKEQFDIIFFHLHKAHVAYEKELKDLQDRKVRSIKARHAKRDEKGRFIKHGKRRSTGRSH